MAVTRPDWVAVIESAIGPIAKAYREGAKESDLYEAALFTVAVDAARAAGGEPLVTDDGSSRSTQMIFRRAPGHLSSKDRFTYAVVKFPRTDRRLEIHLGVLVIGRSGVTHECDIAIMDHRAAERSRLRPADPRWTSLVAAVEAKHYCTVPDLGIGRSFLGLGAEIKRSNCTIAFSGPGSVSISRLIRRHPSEYFEKLVPGTVTAKALEDRLCEQIRNWLDG
jgi:hypothetical protein